GADPSAAVPATAGVPGPSRTSPEIGHGLAVTAAAGALFPIQGRVGWRQLPALGQRQYQGPGLVALEHTFLLEHRHLEPGGQQLAEQPQGGGGALPLGRRGAEDGVQPTAFRRRQQALAQLGVAEVVPGLPAENGPTASAAGQFAKAGQKAGLVGGLDHHQAIQVHPRLDQGLAEGFGGGVEQRHQSWARRPQGGQEQLPLPLKAPLADLDPCPQGPAPVEQAAIGLGMAGIQSPLLAAAAALAAPDIIAAQQLFQGQEWRLIWGWRHGNQLTVWIYSISSGSPAPSRPFVGGDAGG